MRLNVKIDRENVGVRECAFLINDDKFRYWLIFRDKKEIAGITMLVREIERLHKIEDKARGLLRTAFIPDPHAPTAEREVKVVRQWWDGLTDSLKEDL
jgi:hypothetical protein